MGGMPDRIPTTVVDGIAFAEGLRWHQGELWYSDMHGGAVHAWSPGDGDRVVVRLDGAPSGLGWTTTGRLLVASMEDRHLLVADDAGRLEVLADLSGFGPHPINDLVVDGHGRVYVGSFGFDLWGGGEFAPGPVIGVDPDGAASVVADGLAFPNGMVLADGGATLIVAETFGGRLTAFARAADGSLRDRREWAALPAGVTPDGICIDAEGAVWAASPGTCECVRVAPGGQVLDRVSTGARMAITCALGGDDGRRLFIATSPDPRPAAARSGRDGRIDAVTVDVPAA